MEWLDAILPIRTRFNVLGRLNDNRFGKGPFERSAVETEIERVIGCLQFTANDFCFHGATSAVRDSQ
jgi:hypothetical protein